MIQITRKKNRITVRGHAGSGPYGHDLVCAGVSTLLWTLIESIDTLTPNTAIARIESGYADVVIASPTEATKLLMDFFFAGIDFLADEHPDCIRVDDER